MTRRVDISKFFTSIFAALHRIFDMRRMMLRKYSQTTPPLDDQPVIKMVGTLLDALLNKFDRLTFVVFSEGHNMIQEAANGMQNISEERPVLFLSHQACRFRKTGCLRYDQPTGSLRWSEMVES